MKEIGGYIELEYSHGKEYYEDAIALNCGRNALAYLIEAYDIKKIYLPYFLCSSVKDTCIKNNVEISFYHIDENFRPIIPSDFSLSSWFYLVNYYGQLQKSEIIQLKGTVENLILDNAQDFFTNPINGIPTIYTCRKYFGVPDGAYLFSEKKIDRVLELDESYSRMLFLLGRFERTANEFYSLYNAHNKLFSTEHVKNMSKLTHNLLRSIDYDVVKNKRACNFSFLYTKFSNSNKLNLRNVEGAFAYPLLLEEGSMIRKTLQEKKIYIPTLWPDVFENCSENMIEYQMAKNVLPIPVDQRYSIDDMKIISEFISEKIKCTTL